MQNIGADNAGDAFYRYKMPRLLAKIEGRGNGIKTNVVNCVDIAKALERPPEYVLKYFGCELGAQTNYDAKTSTCIVNGAHEAKKLSEVLEGFIKKYVQCYSCGNPETQVKIRKDFILLKCKACGFVSDVDMRHKLNTFILKNPPDDKLSKAEKKIKKQEEERLAIKDEKPVKEEKKEKKEKKEKSEKGEKDEEKDKKKKDKKKKKKEGSNDDEDNDDEDGDDDVVWMTDLSEEAIKRRAEAQLSAATAAMVTIGNIEAEEQAERRRQEKEAQRLAEEEEARKAEEERVKAEAAAAAMAEEAARKMSLNGGSPVDAVRAALSSGGTAAAIEAMKEVSVDGGLAGRMHVLYEAVLGDATDKLANVMKTNKDLFAAFAQDGSGQLAQLIALEHFFAVVAPERMKEASLVLKAMYDLDLADERVIVGWAMKVDAGKILNVPAEAGLAVRKHTQAVVDWLKEEEDDEEDEDDEEEEDD